MHKILQVRLQQYVSQELPDVQAGFRKGRGTRDQIANIRWITEKAREFQKTSTSALLTDYAKAFDCVEHNKLWKILKEMGIRPPYLSPEKSVCRSRSNSWNRTWNNRQSIGVSASASILPINIQDWFPLGLTGWISLQSKGLSRVFSNTTVQKHQFFGCQLSL